MIIDLKTNKIEINLENSELSKYGKFRVIKYKTTDDGLQTKYKNGLNKILEFTVEYEDYYGDTVTLKCDCLLSLNDILHKRLITINVLESMEKEVSSYAKEFFNKFNTIFNETAKGRIYNFECRNVLILSK